jgi:hypothetical protein
MHPLQVQKMTALTLPKTKTEAARRDVAEFVRGCLWSVGSAVPVERILAWSEDEKATALVWADERHAWLDGQQETSPPKPHFLERDTPLGGSFLTFNTFRMPEHGEIVMTAQPQSHFLPRRLVLGTDYAHRAEVTILTVGVMTVAVHGLPLDGALFALDNPNVFVLDWPVVQVGQYVTLGLQWKRREFVHTADCYAAVEGLSVHEDRTGYFHPGAFELRRAVKVGG